MNLSADPTGHVFLKTQTCAAAYKGYINIRGSRFLSKMGEYVSSFFSCSSISNYSLGT